MRTEVIRSVWRSVYHWMKEHLLLSFSLIFALVLAGTSLIFQFAEHDGRGALWRSVVYVMSGLDVDPPQTTAGQIAAVIVLISGVIVVSLLTGYIAAEFSKMLITSRAVPQKPLRRMFENHAILFGWSPKTKAILHQLNADYGARSFRVDDFIVVSDDPFIEKGPEPIYRNVWHLHSPSIDAQTLKMADLTPHRGEGATVAAILSDSKLSSDEADRHSLLTVLAVEHLFPEVISVAEVIHAENEEHFRNAYVDEVLIPKHYGTMLLARASEFLGIADYIDELLSLAPSEKDGTEISEKMPVSLVLRSAEELGVSGSSFREAVVQYYSTHQGIIVGIIQEEQVCLYTDDRELQDVELKPNDCLVLVGTPEQV